MQASAVLQVSPGLNFHGFSKDRFVEIPDELSQEFCSKLCLADSQIDSVEAPNDSEEIIEESEEEEEFSFALANPDGSPISAEDAFEDGQIRPVFPIFDRSLLFDSSSSPSSSSSILRPPLRKIFVENNQSGLIINSPSSESEDPSPETYCEWKAKSSVAVEEEASPEMMSKKSNSTGFCRLWRFRDLVVRSSSDGKDAFVFLNPNPNPNPNPSSDESVQKKAKKKKESESVSSVHERHYVRNRAKKENDKRRSYLPYRPDLVGFFTTVNGFTRNVHPF